MRKSIVFGAAFTAVLTLAGCSDAGGSSSGDSGDSFHIGVVTPSGDHGFTGDSVAHAKAEAERLMGENDNLEITVKDGLEAADQIASIENLLAGGDLDLIMLWPMEGEALRSTAQSILDADVELIIYDRLIDDFEGIEGEIMGDNIGIGTMMGEYVTDFFADDDDVNYLRFVGDSSTVTSQRNEGFDEIVEADNSFEQIANTFQTDWSSEKAQSQLTDWLNTASSEEIADLDLIVTHDDEITDGLMSALESYSNSEDLNIELITSVGGREETIEKFDETSLDVKLTTYYFSPSFIREAERLALSTLTGEEYDGAEETDGTYLIPSFSISNAGDAEMDFDSYRDSDIFTERYSIDD